MRTIKKFVSSQNKKIMLSGSMTFAQQMIEVKKNLEERGFQVLLPIEIERHVDDPTLTNEPDKNFSRVKEEDVMMANFQQIADSDILLSLNYEKTGIKGYFGASMLMEIGLAFYLGKELYALNPYPDPNEHRWAFEVKLLGPNVIDGDLSKINAR